MKKLSQGLLLATLIASQPVLACSKDGKGGFLPENNLKISVNEKGINTISEDQFNSVIDAVEAVYGPIVASHGAKLEIVRNWTDGTVNAYAEQEGNLWKVSMFGGLARHRTVTPDGMSLVVCHEVGHHLGGAPRYVGDDWASNEGQSDYFATTKCLRKVWMNDNNVAIVASMTDVPKTLSDACGRKHVFNVDVAMCIRAGMAGDSVGKLFQALEWSSKPVKFDTPDTREVASTNDNHPAAQCRLDTYFQGALCDKSYNEDFSADSEVTGACHGSTGYKIGLRPRCWFKPTVQ